MSVELYEEIRTHLPHQVSYINGLTKSEEATIKFFRYLQDNNISFHSGLALLHTQMHGDLDFTKKVNELIKNWDTEDQGDKDGQEAHTAKDGEGGSSEAVQQA